MVPPVIQEEHPEKRTAIGSGIRSLKGNVFDAASAASRVLGFDEKAEEFEQTAIQEQQRAAALRPETPTFSEVVEEPSLSRIGQFVGTTVGEQLPLIAASVITGGAGAVGMRGAALIAAKKAATRKMAATAGAKIGATVPIAAATTGETAARLRDEAPDATPEERARAALISGAIQTPLEYLPISRGIGRFTKGTRGSRIKNIAGGALRSGTEEAATEAAQNLVQDATVRTLNPEADVYNLRDPIDAAGAGGTLGVLLGGLGGAATRRRRTSRQFDLGARDAIDQARDAGTDPTQALMDFTNSNRAGIDIADADLATFQQNLLQAPPRTALDREIDRLEGVELQEQDISTTLDAEQEAEFDKYQQGSRIIEAEDSVESIIGKDDGTAFRGKQGATAANNLAQSMASSDTVASVITLEELATQKAEELNTTPEILATSLVDRELSALSETDRASIDAEYGGDKLRMAREEFSRVVSTSAPESQQSTDQAALTTEEITGRITQEETALIAKHRKEGNTKEADKMVKDIANRKIIKKARNKLKPQTSAGLTIMRKLSNRKKEVVKELDTQNLIKSMIDKGLWDSAVGYEQNLARLLFTGLSSVADIEAQQGNSGNYLQVQDLDQNEIVWVSSKERGRKKYTLGDLLLADSSDQYAINQAGATDFEPTPADIQGDEAAFVASEKTSSQVAKDDFTKSASDAIGKMENELQQVQFEAGRAAVSEEVVEKNVPRITRIEADIARLVSALETNDTEVIQAEVEAYRQRRAVEIGEARDKRKSKRKPQKGRAKTIRKGKGTALNPKGVVVAAKESEGTTPFIPKGKEPATPASKTVEEAETLRREKVSAQVVERDKAKRIAKHDSYVRATKALEKLGDVGKIEEQLIPVQEKADVAQRAKEFASASLELTVLAQRVERAEQTLRLIKKKDELTTKIKSVNSQLRNKGSISDAQQRGLDFWESELQDVEQEAEGYFLSLKPSANTVAKAAADLRSLRDRMQAERDARLARSTDVVANIEQMLKAYDSAVPAIPEGVRAEFAKVSEAYHADGGHAPLLFDLYDMVRPDNVSPALRKAYYDHTDRTDARRTSKEDYFKLMDDNETEIKKHPRIIDLFIDQIVEEMGDFQSSGRIANRGEKRGGILRKIILNHEDKAWREDQASNRERRIKNKEGAFAHDKKGTLKTFAEEEIELLREPDIQKVFELANDMAKRNIGRTADFFWPVPNVKAAIANGAKLRVQEFPTPTDSVFNRKENENLNKKHEGTANAWLNRLGIKGSKVKIITAERAKALAIAAKRDPLEYNPRGFMHYDKKTDTYEVFVANVKDQSAMIETMAHEVGHVIMAEMLGKTDFKDVKGVVAKLEPMTIKQRESQDIVEQMIYEHYKTVTQKYNGDAYVRDILGNRTARNIMESAGIKDVKISDKGKTEYFLSFDEWFADNVSRWLTTQAEPRKAIDAFFSEIANMLRRLFHNVGLTKGMTQKNANAVVSKYLKAEYTAKPLVVPEGIGVNFKITEAEMRRSLARFMKPGAKTAKESIDYLVTHADPKELLNLKSVDAMRKLFRRLHEENAPKREYPKYEEKPFDAGLVKKVHAMLSGALGKKAADEAAALDDHEITVSRYINLAGAFQNSPDSDYTRSAIEFALRDGRYFTSHELNIIQNAASKGAIRSQLGKLFKGNDRVLEQIDGDPNIAAAYAFQFWYSKELQVGTKTETVFQKLLQMIRNVLGIITDADNTAEIFKKFTEGDFADRLAGGTPFEVVSRKSDNFVQNGFQAMEDISKPLRDLLSSAFSTAAEQVDRLENAQLTALRRMFYTRVSSVNERESYVAARGRIIGEYDADLFEIFASRGLEKDKVFGEGVTEVLNSVREAEGEKEKAVVKDIRALMQRAFNYQRAAGMGIKHEGKTYFPRVFNTELLEGGKETFIENISAEKYEPELRKLYAPKGDRELTGHERKQAAEMIFNTYIRNYGDTETTADELLREQQEGVGDVDFHGAPLAASAMQRTFGWIESEDVAQFMEKDIELTLTKYFSQMAKKAEYVRRFGVDGEGKAKAGRRSIDDYLEAARKSGASEADIEVAENFIKAVMGRLAVDKINPKFQKLQGWILVVQNYAILGMATLTSLVDPLGIAVRGDLDTAWISAKAGINQIAASIKGESKTSQRLFGEMIGAIDRGTTLEALGVQYGGYYVTGKAHEWNEKLFKMNGLEGWTNFTRNIATTGGIHFIKKHVANPDKNSARYLEELGLKDGDVDATKENLGILENIERARLRNEEARIKESGEAWEGSEQIAAYNALNKDANRHERNRQFKTIPWEEAPQEVIDKAIKHKTDMLAGLHNKRGEFAQLLKQELSHLEEVKGEPKAKGKAKPKKVSREEQIREILRRDDRVRAALNRFVDEAILRPDAAQRPIWGSDPRFMLIVHLKSFTFSFHERILRRVVNELFHGNYAPLITLAAYSPAMLLIMSLKDAIRGDDDDDEEQTFISAFAEGSERGGLLGTAQFGWDAIQDVDRGGIGLKPFSGPAITHSLQLGSALWTFDGTADKEIEATKRGTPGYVIWKDWNFMQTGE